MKCKATVITLCIFFAALFSANAADIYVSPNGSDKNPGTKEKPMATIAMALRKVREMRRTHDKELTGHIKIIVLGGTYTLHEPIFIRPEDSGGHETPITIEGAPGERPVISGGTSITRWRKPKGKIDGLPASAQKQVWVADAPEVGGRLLEFRQLWINEQKAIRARDRNGDSMNRILNWNHQTEKCVIPLPATPALNKAVTLEMVIHQWWAIAILRIKAMDIRGDSAELSFHQPESRIQSEHPWPAPWLSKKTGNSAFYLTNAIQLLDQPGEWFLDMQNRRVVYWPREGEDMRTANVVAPVLETLVKIEGTINRPVGDIAFRNLDFRYTTWLRPSQAGHVPLQAGMYLLDAYKLNTPYGTYDKSGLENQAWIGRQPAGIELSYVTGTWFDKCRFAHMAATGVDYIRGASHDGITGCVFYDIGGTAIQAGTFSDEAFETHLPFNPRDELELVRNLHIANNLITHCTTEDWGCVGISAGHVQHIKIEHNEVSYVNYSGICVGWGWTKTEGAARNNLIHANLVHHYARNMYDVGGIYTLGAQPGSVISENCVHSIFTAPYAHDPDHFFYMYLDEGSSGITIKNNWLEKEKVMKNANGPGNVWENNGPMVSEKIKNAAGLQPEYKHLLKKF